MQNGELEIGPGQLGPGKYALLGDNRALPSSAVVHSVVPKDRLVGKVFFRFHW